MFTTGKSMKQNENRYSTIRLRIFHLLNVFDPNVFENKFSENHKGVISKKTNQCLLLENPCNRTRIATQLSG